MAIRSDEITSIIRSEIKAFDEGVDVSGVGTIVEVGDGIAQVYGLSGALAQELLDFAQRDHGHGLQPRGGDRRRPDPGRLHLAQGGRPGQDHRPHRRGAGRRRADRPGGEPARRAARRQGQDRDDQDPPDRAHRPRRHRAPAGRHAGADRHQGHRLDDPHRPRPARADHRRPPDRQDRDRDRHDHQPEGQEPHLHLRRHRPEAVDGGAGGGPARGVGRHGPHDRGLRRRQRSGPAPVPGPLRRRDDGRGVHGRRAATRCASTTTCRSTRGPTARSRS